MVFRYGVGVSAVDRRNSAAEDSSNSTGEGLQIADDGSWQWSVGRDAPDVLRRNAEFVVGRIEDLDTDLRGDSVLAIQLGNEPALFVFGEALSSIEMLTLLSLDEFEGLVRFVHDVKGEEDYHFLELAGGRIRQGRLESGAEKVFDSGQFAPAGWIGVRVVSDGTHFRAYIGEEMLVHGHNDEPEPGRAGLYLEGKGAVKLRYIRVVVLRPQDH